MDHWHECETYRTFGFECPAGLHPEEERADDQSLRESAEAEVAFPWEFLLPTATAIALRGILESYQVGDADADKIRRFPLPKTRRMPDIPDELAALIAIAAFLLLLRGSVRALSTARAAERVAISAMAAVPGAARSPLIGQMIGGTPRTGTVMSPIGSRLPGPATVRRKKRKERERGSNQAGQFQSFGEWWYQGLHKPQGTWIRNYFLGDPRFDPKGLPEWIKWNASRNQLASAEWDGRFNENWDREGWAPPPWAAGPGD